MGDVQYLSMPMIGSVIPGIARAYTAITKTYPDFTDHELIKGKRRAKGIEVHKFPLMNQDHGKGQSIMETLKKLIQNHHSGPHPHQQQQEGYERVKENLDWRRK